MELIKRAWRGEERLWKVFWIYGALLGFGIAMVGLMIKAMWGLGAYLFFWLFRLVYLVWITVAQWKCAFNTEWKFWGYVVRVLIVLSLLAIPLILIGLMAGGVIIGQDLVKAAECRKETQEYAAKGWTDVERFKQDCIQRKLHTNPGISSAPAVLPPLPAIDPNQAQYNQQCEKTMADYAQSKGFDPKVYIAQNQAYLQQCVQYYIHQHSTEVPKTP